jgi:aldose sugar dehydrogenase
VCIVASILLSNLLITTCEAGIFQENRVYATTLSKPQDESGPLLRDPNLKVEILFRGIKFPSSMAFLGPDDILVLEKNEGTVKRIVNGVMLPDSLLKVNVSTVGERGMLGIAVTKENKTANKPLYVFLYYTEAIQKSDLHNDNADIRNRLYRYELTDNKLVNPKLLLDLLSGPRAIHNAGAIVVGQDDNLYLAVGDVLDTNPQDKQLVDGTAGILRVDQEGNSVRNNDSQYILGNTHPLNKYYAYGIRNSFGLDFDPETGRLWDTENGQDYGEEINLVEPGFNSGWKSIQGFWEGGDLDRITLNPHDVLDFGGRAQYSSPEFASIPPLGLTGLTFVDSDTFPQYYKGGFFVGDFHNGFLYYFDLSSDRKSLYLTGVLQDKIANSTSELQENIIGERFGGITDIEVGPDGNLYVLSLYQGGDDCRLERTVTDECIGYTSALVGTIFKIAPMVTQITGT